MKLSLHEFKAIHSDKDKTVLKHPSGHELHLRNTALSPKERGEIVHMKDGGMAVKLGAEDFAPSSDLLNKNAQELGYKVSQKPQGDPEILKAIQDYDQSQSPEAGMMNLMHLAGNEPPQIPQPQGLAPQQPENPQMGDQPQIPQDNDPYGMAKYGSMMQQGYGQQMSGSQQGYQAEKEKGLQEAAALQQGIQAQQDLLKTHKEVTDQLMNERHAMMSDAMNGHINPNQLWDNKSTPGKISTAIGLILGGMGGGLMHQENPALKFLNAQIDRDVEAQKINQSNKFSLLNANRQSLENEIDATNMTKVMLADSIMNKLKLAAANTTDPAAKSRLLMAEGQINAQYAPLMQNINMRQTMMKGMNNNPAMVIKAMVPPEQQDHYFKELKEKQDTHSYGQNVMSGFDQISKLQNVSSRLGSPWQSNEQINAIMNPLIASLSKGTAGRFTESDSGMLKPLFPKLNDDAYTRAAKRQRLQQLITEKMHFPMLDTLPGMGGSQIGMQVTERPHGR